VRKIRRDVRREIRDPASFYDLEIVWIRWIAEVGLKTLEKSIIDTRAD